jgi:hypothetical protein
MTWVSELNKGITKFETIDPFLVLRFSLCSSLPVGNTLFLVSIIVGGITGCIAIIVEVSADWFKDSNQVGDENTVAFLLGKKPPLLPGVEWLCKVSIRLQN